MAIYHCTVKPISRSSGRSATAAAAYRSAAQITDERTGEHHDYRRRGGVLHVELCTPSRAPAWAADRAALWNKAEVAEKRKDARVAREIEVSLPHELKPAQRLELARAYGRDLVNRYGVAVDMALHQPHRKGDERNHHVHYLLTTRALEPEGFAKGKADLELPNRERKKRGMENCAEALKAERAIWARHLNRELERAGVKDRVDHRSFKDRGIDRQPTHHMGPEATQMQRKGKKSRIGEQNRAVECWNRERDEAQWQLKVVEAAIEAEKKRLAAEKAKDKARGSAGKARGGFQKAAPLPATQAERANARRAAIQGRHLDETRELEGRQDRERFSLESGLDDFYGKDLKQDQAELRQIEESLKGRLSRRGREKAEELAEALRRNINSARQRLQEQRGALAVRQEEDKARFLTRQAQERRATEQNLEREPTAPAINDNREQAVDLKEERARAIEAFKERMREQRAAQRGRDKDRGYER